MCRFINRAGTSGHYTTAQTQYIPAGFKTPSGATVVLWFYSSGWWRSFHSAPRFLLHTSERHALYVPPVNVPASCSCVAPLSLLLSLSLFLSLSLSCSHTLPPSISHACSCAGTDRACRLPPDGHPQHQQHKRRSEQPEPGFTSARIDEEGKERTSAPGPATRCRDLLLLHVHCVRLFFFNVISIFTTLMTLSPHHTSHFSHWPAQIFCSILRRCVCVCVCVRARARCKWAGTCNLIRLKMRKRRCQQAKM